MKTGYTIETINGIFTKEGSLNGTDGAKANRKAVERFFPSTYRYRGESLTVDYLYNPTYGPLDLSDTAIQKTFEGVDMKDSDFLKILTDASAQIKTQKVLLVAHSQGNFYANNFYDAVTKSGDVSAGSIGVYGVAVPASKVAGDGIYRTSDTDTVINLARKVFPGKTLKANDSINYKDSDDSGRGHGFREIYLEYRGEEIKKEIEESLGKLSVDSTRSEDGPCINPPEEPSVADKIITKIVIYPADFALTSGVVGVNIAKNIIVVVAKGTYHVGILIGNVTIDLAVKTAQVTADVAIWTANTAVDVATATYNAGVNLVVGTYNVAVSAGSSVASSVSSFFSWLNNNGGDSLGSSSNMASAIMATTNSPENSSPASDTSGTNNGAETTVGQPQPVDESYEIIYDSANENFTSENPVDINNTPQEVSSASSAAQPVRYIVIRPSSGGNRGNTQPTTEITATTTATTTTSTATETDQTTSTGTPEIPPTEATSTPPVVTPTDTTAPVITIFGRNPATVAANSVYTDLGASAEDNIDGVRPVEKSGEVDTSISGAYLITYTASDLSHNTATSTRTVNVIATTSGPTTPTDLNGNGIPDNQEEDVIITSNATLPAGEYNFNNLTITNNAKLTTEGDVNSTEIFKGVKINAINLTITSGASISGDGNGYLAGMGFGAPVSAGPGASYGGVGYNNSISSTYGSATHPLDLGSGAARQGGGAIRLAVSEILQNDGTVSANGLSSGSGGSIYVTSDTIKGNGIFQVNGGPLYASGYLQGPGGGGRMALYYQTSSFAGTAEAKGGCGSYDGFSMTCAEKGTVGLFDVPNNNLRIDTSFRFQKNDSPLNFNKILVTNGAEAESEDESNIVATELLVENGSSLVLANNQTLIIPNVVIDGTSVLTLSGSGVLNLQNLTLQNGNSRITVAEEHVLSLNVVNLNIGSGTSITSDGKGYKPRTGLGAPTNAGGASYGGVGFNNISTSTYGSTIHPTDFGSGGADSGGGAIRIIVAGAFINDGSVLASGNPSGSGGSIYVTTNNLAGSGIFRANGGGLYNRGYFQGPGGGGRVAIRYDNSSFNGTAEAKGGCGSYDGSSMSCGGDGSVVMESTNATYSITARAGENGAITPTGVTNLPVGANQTYTFEPLAGYEIGTVTVDGVSLPVAASYTFNEIISAHTIDVTFSQIPAPPDSDPPPADDPPADDPPPEI
ncbi:MAG: DUF5011 domain-containing protein [Candidatus Pacebacteria bacterium]|nr:DUF5011 domain-containing protein [Candidatus Paceibacterota bacterium]